MPPELVPDPIIVYGAPRSGTTYLERILNSHPAVFISHETRVFGWMNQALALAQDDMLVLHHRDAFVDQLRDVLPQMIRDFYRTLAPDGVRYWGDKNPHYADNKVRGCLDMVAEVFPGSRFIHIIRDGRDVVTSLVRKQAEGTPWVTFEQANHTWKWHVHFGRQFGQSMPPDRYFELRYEDLVTHDIALAHELFDFLGIGFHPAVEAFCRGQQAHRTPFKGPTRDLAKGVTASDWSDVFSLEEQARSLELIGQDLIWHGYETEESLAHLRERIAEALDSRDRGASAGSAPSVDG